MSEAVTLEQLKDATSRSSFYAGMRILPKAEREAMFAIYGFCRLVDDIADGDQQWAGVDKAQRAKALDGWRRDIDALYAGDDPGKAAFLVEVVQRFGLERADFQAIIDGMQMDLDEDIRWPSFEMFDLYCDRVASAVGRLSVRVFGMEREPGLALAHHLGRALQFTNVLRDIDEDAGIGRVYLPIEALQAAGIAPETPEKLLSHPQLGKAALWLAAKAGGHFTEAHDILKAKPKGLLLAPRLMEASYFRIWRKMLHQGWAPPRKRISTNKPLLVLTAVKLWLLG
ncbi:MAG: presqualene diphosphate synthase HpnD [Novosphingobium sp.]